MIFNVRKFLKSCYPRASFSSSIYPPAMALFSVFSESLDFTQNLTEFNSDKNSKNLMSAFKNQHFMKKFPVLLL